MITHYASTRRLKSGAFERVRWKITRLAQQRVFAEIAFFFSFSFSFSFPQLLLSTVKNTKTCSFAFHLRVMNVRKSSVNKVQSTNKTELRVIEYAVISFFLLFFLSKLLYVHTLKYSCDKVVFYEVSFIDL